MTKAYLGLGSNVGNSIELIKSAIEFIDNSNNCSVTGKSSLYETSPYGDIEQNNFINCAMEISTGLTPEELLKFTKNAEINLGRKKRERWGPREVDIDILLYDDLAINIENLCVPHEDLTNRDFVLVPLLEINPELVHPVSKKLLRDYLDTIGENHILKRLK